MLAARTALRYLFARKSHSAVNIISIVSVCGIAVATMALVCVMSVYNGFQEFLGQRVDSLLPDVEVRPATGKVIANADSIALELSKMAGVADATPLMDDNMMILSGNTMVPVRVLGVNPDDYARVTSISSVIAPGGSYRIGFPDDTDPEAVMAGETDESFDEEIDANASMDYNEADLDADASDLYADDVDMTEPDLSEHISYGLFSSDLMTQLYGGKEDREKAVGAEPVHMIAPRRTGELSITNPQNALLSANVAIAGMIPADKANLGSATAILDIRVVRDMLEYTDEGSAIYIKAAEGTSPEKLAGEIGRQLGAAYKVTDRDSQLSVNLNMMRIEKWVTFLLLAFILLIASFNIISTLSMLIIEKKRSIRTMRTMGATKGFIGEIFCWESCFVCFSGTLIGMGAGLALCWLQKEFGFIEIPNGSSSLIIDRYPVAVKWTDMAWLMIPSALIALVTALVSSAFARRNASL